MQFDVYFAIQTPKGLKPGVTPEPHEWSWIVDNILKNENWSKQIDEYRKTKNKELKTALPSINFVGRSVKTRANADMIPTQLVMVDIDHLNRTPEKFWEDFKASVEWDWLVDHLVIAHVSPGGEGVHLIFKSLGHNTLLENMNEYDSMLFFDQYGEYDVKVHDYARVSFSFKYDELLFENTLLYLETEPDLGDSLINDDFVPLEEREDDEPKKKKNDSSPKDKSMPELTEDDIKRYRKMEYRGFGVGQIVDKYVEKHGNPSEGEVHNYYNEMVKNFRHITSNNKTWLLAVLPRFGHTAEECWSQIKSITRVNTMSKMPYDFWRFLADNGFYAKSEQEASALKEYMMSDVERDSEGLPTLPPVFREFVKAAPKDFRISVINALMSIMGFLSTWVKAKYPYDDRWHTCSFFSIIYAPASTGKGFVERLLDPLLYMVRVRDELQAIRENIYLRFIQRKGANDKAPELPHTSIRIIPAKCSEAEFLEKQRDNQGAHMFTFAAEMDSWAKGEKAAGGNKSDMIRVAWDNGEYGQQFKSANTFRGKVHLYWNVLITGTIAQVNSYFKNVENGLVTRCCFTTIENQEFQMAEMWKPIPRKGLDVITNYVERCDANTYVSPCNVDIDEAYLLSDDEFDEKIDWKFKFKEKQEVDLSWIMPVIDEFLRAQCEEAALAVDRARDTFRRRVAVRGFRLALLCTTLYPRISLREKKIISNFVKWWMAQDIECALALWAKKYNEVAEPVTGFYNRNVYAQLDDVFDKNDLYVVCKKEGIKTRIKQIIYQWKKTKHIVEDKETGKYKKVYAKT